MILDSSPVALDRMPAFADLPGAELIWWREDGDWHTLVSIDCDVEGSNFLEPGSLGNQRLLFAWFAPDGTFIDARQVRVASRGHATVDSRNLGVQFDRTLRTPAEGVLAVALWPAASLDASLRIYATVDWHSHSGNLVSLHSDQAYRRTSQSLDFTEIVVRESPESRNSLVITNGPVSQDARSLTLEVTNSRGQKRAAAYDPPMAPFSLHRLPLASLFPRIEDFAGDQEVTVGGRFECRSLYVRPYVVTEGARAGGYHGGERYDFRRVTRFEHWLLGRGETNPMAVVETDELSTTVNLLHSHGDVEGDYWVDAHLHDTAGTLVVHRPRWLLARRDGLSRANVRDLLPDAEPFAGHLCLSFSKSEQPFYPRRLQALMEYRGARSIARVMAWSDLWNAREHIASVLASVDPRLRPANWGPGQCPEPGRVYSARYRAWCNEEMRTWLAITNAGTVADYRATITYDIELTGADGRSLRRTRELAPFATDFEPIDAIFPEAASLLADGGVGMVRVSSSADLASVQFTRHRSGAWGAEHLIADGSLFEGVYRFPSGS